MDRIVENMDRIEEFASTTASKPKEVTMRVGEKLESLAGVIREKAPHEGTMATAATAVADKLEVAGFYLQEKPLKDIPGDLSVLVRRYPVQSVLIGLGIGYLLARSRRR